MNKMIDLELLVHYGKDSINKVIQFYLNNSKLEKIMKFSGRAIVMKERLLLNLKRRFDLLEKAS